MSDVAMAAVQAYLKELRLPAFARLLPETLREAESQGRPFLDVLRVLLEGELAQRQINQGRRRIREARFPYAKDLAEFDFTANPTIKKSQILSLVRISAKSVAWIGRCRSPVSGDAGRAVRLPSVTVRGVSLHRATEQRWYSVS